MRFDHVDLHLREQIILDLLRLSLASSNGCRSVSDLDRGSHGHSLFKHVQVKKFLHRLTLALLSEQLRNVRDVLKWEGQGLLRLLHRGLVKFEHIPGGLQRHHGVVSLKGRDRRIALVQIGEARLRVEAGTASGSTALVDGEDRLIRKLGLQARQQVVHRVHFVEFKALKVGHHGSKVFPNEVSGDGLDVALREHGRQDVLHSLVVQNLALFLALVDGGKLAPDRSVSERHGER